MKVPRVISEDRGNVESSLTLIPLILLFLLAMQIVLAISMRDADSLGASDQASVRAISGEFSSTDRELTLISSDRFSNISLLIATQSRRIPQLIPGLSQLLGRELKTDGKGVAIIENTR